MKLVHSATHIKALPYDMLLTKIFKISPNGEVLESLRPTDTINIHTFKHFRIVKEHGQWVACTKGFNSNSGPLTLPLDEAEDEVGVDREDDVL